MQRVTIIGPAAAGKSTLARKLGDLTGIETFHLDELFWGPRCTPMPVDEWDALLGEIVARPKWIIDGNFTASLPARLARADTVVFVDLPRVVCLAAAVKRRLLFGLRRPPGMARDCRPMFNLTFLRWIWSFQDDHRPYYLELLSRPVPGRTVVILRRRREVRRFVAEVTEHVQA
jgi:adenylate kinase family enzyme